VTIEFLECVKKLRYPNYEVIIVDNASTNDYTDLLEDKYPFIKLIRSHENLGFAGGNNLGINEASGDYLFFVNNDTEFSGDVLFDLVEVLESNNKIGMVSPKVKYYGTNIIQYAGSKGINKRTSRGITIGLGEEDEGKYDIVCETELGFGTAMLVPMEVIKKVSLMPDIYFLYYEEHDWCESIKNADYKIYYCGKVEVLHKESMSVGKNSPLKTYFMTRNRLLFMRRNTRGIDLLSSFLFYLFISMPKKIILYILKGEWNLIIPFIKGNLWNLFNCNVYHSPKIKDEHFKNLLENNQTKKFKIYNNGS
jgi:hypothetical protein